MANAHLKSLLYSPNISSQKVFRQAFKMYLDSCEETRFVFLLQSCDNEHNFQEKALSIAGKIFNLFSKNYSSEINSEIHSKRGRKTEEKKRDPLAMKVAKLQSEKL
jgi:hypothetical protein